MYLKIKNDGSRVLFAKKPDWRMDDGSIVTDEVLREYENMYPVKDEIIDTEKYDFDTKEPMPKENWKIKEGTYIERAFYLIKYPEYDPFSQIMKLKENAEDFTVNDKFLEKYIVEDIPIEEIKRREIDKIKNLRWKYETGGITFLDYDIHTDRESQSKILSLYVLTKQGELQSINWKTKNGFALLNATEIEQLSLTVQQFIQKCYDNEKRLSSLVKDAITTSDLKEIKYDRWPENSLYQYELGEI